MNVPVLYPGTTQEILDFGRHGFTLSRYASLWVGMKVVTLVADGAGTADVSADRIQPTVPFDERGVGGDIVRPTTSALVLPLDLERDLYEYRLDLARSYAAANDLNAITVATSSDRLGIAASGHTYYEVVEALRRLGLDDAALRSAGVRLLRIGMPYPLDRAIVRTFAAGLQEVLVVEEKRPFIEIYIHDALYGIAERAGGYREDRSVWRAARSLLQRSPG